MNGLPCAAGAGLTGRVDGLGFWMAFSSDEGKRGSMPPVSEEDGAAACP
ncbi:MAG: hypothetical protein JO345_30355 [Streptosporangiaceae bacterium]|nr:hypothetical protein [Streptosporangiaceae bacterium]